MMILNIVQSILILILIIVAFKYAIYFTIECMCSMELYLFNKMNSLLSNFICFVGICFIEAVFTALQSLSNDTVNPFDLFLGSFTLPQLRDVFICLTLVAAINTSVKYTIHEVLVTNKSNSIVKLFKDLLPVMLYPVGLFIIRKLTEPLLQKYIDSWIGVYETAFDTVSSGFMNVGYIVTVILALIGFNTLMQYINDDGLKSCK